MAEKNPQAVVMVAMLALAGLGASVFFLLAAPNEPAPAVAAAAQVDPVATTPAVEPAQPKPQAQQVNEVAPEAPRRGVRPRDRMARDLERERIWSALRRQHGLDPAAPGAAAPTPSAAAQLPALDPQYIESAIAEQLVPVAIECYESALEDQPELAGKLIANFTIVGAEDIGGIVEDAAISDESTLDSPFVRECMRESLMAVSFDPPADGGRVEVTYPFVFEPE
ncbi:AgmX/PglI C-terminal domain-containing protein [Enhygromyxa salina]|uniref:Uncharacterized protein n=1 Tax=Enhygromyxa salina TaxID=215803 RepID=A0A2S9YLX5_9BACT|nr:AgmX/PglI C-terminal domain-containing protein [Enhygromyxa salina]PRQ06105.1 hypothetical protein ENSA7_41390 [Enhygromyxa salina]